MLAGGLRLPGLLSLSLEHYPSLDISNVKDLLRHRRAISLNKILTGRNRKLSGGERGSPANDTKGDV